MSAGALLEELRRKDVHLEADGTSLRVNAPTGVTTDELRATLAKLKPELLELLAQERAEADRNTEGADRRGLVIRWSEHPTWIELRDPTTGERHEVRASECLPGVVEAADRRLKKGGVA
jgi:hypothetical protein